MVIEEAVRPLPQAAARSYAALFTEMAGDLAERLRASLAVVQSADAHTRGGGSGTIWTSDGVIITNHHVVPTDGARVTLWDGRDLDARVIARDAERDLVALRVDAQGLSALPMGDPSALRVGEMVFASGNPLGQRGVVTAGIVHRLGDGPHITADIRLAPGNSGGPLVDAQGRLLGINAMIAGGLGVAISVQAVVDLLAGVSPRPRLGVVMTAVVLPERVSASLASGQTTGLLVLEVHPHSIAEAGDLRAGDILLALDGQPLADPGDVAYHLHRRVVGQILEVTLLRAGQPLTRSVTVATAG